VKLKEIKKGFKGLIALSNTRLCLWFRYL